MLLSADFHSRIMVFYEPVPITVLGSSSVDSASDTSTKVAVSRSLSARESLRESAQGRQNSSSSSNGGQGNKVMYLANLYFFL